MMTGNHRTSCTFTTQQIGRWVVTHSKADSNLHGHCLDISRKQCPLWILFMSQHSNPSSALSDHRESVAWLISNGPHSIAYCYNLGANRVKAECLCPQKAATIFQHTQQQIVLGHSLRQIKALLPQPPVNLWLLGRGRWLNLRHTSVLPLQTQGNTMDFDPQGQISCILTLRILRVRAC